MTKAREAFTLIELLISVTILSIMIIFLYKSYSSLNYSNKTYKQESTKIKDHQMKKKVIFLDFSLKTSKDINISNQDKHKDIVFFQSSNSIHKRYNPHIAYIAKGEKLYRLESLKKLNYPLSSESIFDVDYFGEINDFRVYKATNTNKASDDVNSTDANSTVVKIVKGDAYLVHVDFKKEEDILYKVSPLE